MLTRVERIVTVAHRDSCNLAHTDLLINPDTHIKLDYFTARALFSTRQEPRHTVNPITLDTISPSFPTQNSFNATSLLPRVHTSSMFIKTSLQVENSTFFLVRRRDKIRRRINRNTLRHVKNQCSAIVDSSSGGGGVPFTTTSPQYKPSLLHKYRNHFKIFFKRFWFRIAFAAHARL